MIVTIGDVSIKCTQAEYAEFMRMLSMNQIDMQFTELNGQILRNYKNRAESENQKTDDQTRG